METLNLFDFINKIEKETKGCNQFNIKIMALHGKSSNEQQNIIESKVLDVALDENHNILYIEIEL